MRLLPGRTALGGLPRRWSTKTSGKIGFWDSPARANDNQLILARGLGDEGLTERRTVPSGPRTLVRRFIADALYSPVSGYFTQNKSLRIFATPEAIDFKGLASLTAFQEALARLYEAQSRSSEPGMERPLTPQMDSGGQATGFRSQVWHTPTELFKPWFGIAVAERIVERHLSRQQIQSDLPLIIYEAGPGNGTLMLNILDHLRDQHPSLYATVEYTVVEISPNLAQRLPLQDPVHASKVRLSQKSILDWADVEERHCFVIAMEVIVRDFFLG